MDIRIIYDEITRKELEVIATDLYGDLIKGVVDIKREIICIGGEMHADSEEVLLNDGSSQEDLWGFNILMDRPKEDCLIYESLINIRPKDNNKDLEVQDPKLRETMKRIILGKIIE